MANPYFKFKQFTVFQDRSAMKVTTDSCFFGAWCAAEISETGIVNSNLLDIGTGTALLSLMIAQKNKVHIDAVEIEAGAASQAAENVKASSWADRIFVIHQNILHLDEEKKYGLIVSNPPFYESELGSGKQNKNIAHHSEELKLAEVAKIIKGRLEQNGFFFLLLPYKRIKEIDDLLSDMDLFIQKKITVKQSTRHDPFRVMIMGTNRAGTSSATETISIRDENDHYTSRFIELLKDYYLYLDNRMEGELSKG
jgi:tRNA1Val (adenine37-N6)-methyltransferase